MLAVESVAGKVSGAWALKGTRMPVSAIFENLEEGANIDDIMQWYEGLERNPVKAVIEFAVMAATAASRSTRNRRNQYGRERWLFGNRDSIDLRALWTVQ